MARFQLNIPAWHHAEEGDKPVLILLVWLDHLPRLEDQIEVPGGGVVEVANIRHRPQWTGLKQVIKALPGGRSEHIEAPPEVFTHWVHRPEGAPKSRTPPHKLGIRG